MASIPENVRILWPSSASTPSGWTTDTAFNDVMPYSANSGSGTGGANTHTHNGNSHSHSGGSHSHSTAGLAAKPSQSPYFGPNASYLHWTSGGSGRSACHYHGGGSLSSTTTGSSSGGSGNYSSGSSLPSYYTFRIIKSDGTGDGFPANSVVLWGTASNPTTQSGWSQHGGSVGKVIRGASNGGSSGGGGSHSHGSSGNHTHGGGGGSHSHNAGCSPQSNQVSGGAGQGGGCEENIFNPQVNAAHTHTIPSAGSGTASGTANAAGGGTSGGTTINDPPYIQMWGVTNSSDSWLEVGIGFISGETLSTFTDEGWVLCDGNNSTINLNASKYIKLSASGGAVGGTGGSTSHNHSGPGSHSHPGGGSHSHTLSASNSGTTNFPSYHGSSQAWGWGSGQGGGRVMSPTGHCHAFNSTTSNNSGTGSYGSSSQGIAAASSVYPSYKTVTWIMAPEEPSAGGNMAMFGANF